MNCLIVLLLAFAANIQASPLCPYGNNPVCGRDGWTYKNVCILELAKSFDQNLEIYHTGPCNLSSRNDWHSQGHHRQGEQLLRKRNPSKKKLSEKNEANYLIDRMISTNFNFLRNLQQLEEQQQED